MSTKKKPKSSENLDFEAISEKLESLVSQLENDEDLSLEESLAAFETGVKLTREAQKLLSEAEQKVKVLLEKNGEPIETEFEADESDTDDTA